MTKTWAVLHDRDARLCLTGVLVSGFGTSALWLVSGVWVKDLTGSDGLAALSMLAMWLPTLAGPLLGTIADRIRRKPLLIGGNLLMAALLPVLLTERVAVVLAVLLVYGTTGVVLDAAESALVAGAVAPSLLGDFNGLRTAVNEGMKLVAPLAGAGLYALWGGPAVALLDATTFVLAALLYRGLRVREDEPGPSRRTPFVEGARHIWAHPALRPLILAGAGTMLCAGVNGALMYAVIDGLGHSPAYAGALYAVQGAGSVAVGLLSGPALRRLGGRRFAVYGIVLTAVAAGLRAVPSDPLALVCSAAVGLGLPCVLVAALTAVQRETPDALLGRAVATANTLVFAPNVLGLAVGAALVEPVDQRPLSAVMGVVWLASSVPLLQRRARAERIASRSPSDANPA
ncbi:MFS transporter [Streptomyces sp. NPDC091972]|uniref:MFS transporter n=1 Tax=Streptomyces sp. NPDC091972 TaxID=3366007 RepID=UPI0038000B14